jgi:predicted transcriptional regulator of viral defense system
MREKSASPDHAAARVAGRQHGVVSVGQLAVTGLTHDSIRRRVEAGRLHRIHRGVYAVGHRALSMEGVWMAAVLACGGGAALSHRSAAALWRMLPGARVRST